MNEKEVLNQEFHQIIGGSKRYDLRFYLEPEAVETRNLISEIYKNRPGEISIKNLAKEIGVAESTLSLAIGGRSGRKPKENLSGLSSTEYVVERLREIKSSKISCKNNFD